MADVVKRVHYFDHQFLHVGDFETEQNYHRDMRLLHNRLLHTPGIADGLVVSMVGTGSTQVKVTAGAAVDKNGAEIVLANDGTEELSSRLAVAPATTRDVYLVIAHNQALSDHTSETGGVGDTRWSEDPKLSTLENPPGPQSPSVLLAKVTLSQTAVTNVDPAGRRTAGAVVGDLAVSALTLRAAGVDSSKWVRVAGSGQNEATLTGTLAIARTAASAPDGNLTVAGSLGVGVTAPQQPLSVGGGLNIDQAEGNNGTVQDTLTFGSSSGEGIGSKRTLGGENQYGLDLYTNSLRRVSITNAGDVGIGTSSPARRLHVEGTEIHSGGSGAGLSFGDRGSAGLVDTRGDRWVWYSDARIARLWTPEVGDILAATTGSRVGIGTTSPQQALSVVGGLNIDQADANDGTIAAALTFGSGSGEGIASKRTAGANRSGLDFYTGSTRRMTITLEGSVGIGTASPSRLLHVEGDEIHSGGSRGGLSFGDRGSTGLADTLGDRWVWYSDARVARLWTPIHGEVLAVTTDGNVGVGTLSPQSRIDVGGGDIRWARSILSADQGGSIELGGMGHIAGVGEPYIDFHFRGETKDFSVRLINDGADRLTLMGGDLRVLGGLDATGVIGGTIKAFVIDHPLDPDAKSLVHSSLEGPETAVYYRGESRLVGGEATVELPEYFEALVREDDRTVQLTPKLGDGRTAGLAASEVRDGRFRVQATDDANPGQEFYWEVKAVRADVPVLEVEQVKSAISELV